MDDQKKSIEVLKDSALILAAVAGVLYSWGFLSETFLMIRISSARLPA